jgi:hypothetical protein
MGYHNTHQKPINWTRVTHVVFGGVNEDGVWLGNMFVWPDPWLDVWDDYLLVEPDSWLDTWDDEYFGGS